MTTQRTLTTKAFFGLDAHKTAPILRSEFLLASESGLTMLWALYHGVLEVSQTDPNPSTIDLLPVEEGLELEEMFNRLSLFERDKQDLGFVENPDFTYPRATYYHDEAPQRGVVFNLDNGAAVTLTNLSVPLTGGHFREADIEAASKALQEKATRQNQDDPIISEMLFSPHSTAELEIDYDRISKIARFNNEFDTLNKAFSAAHYYLTAISAKERFVV